MKLRVDVGEESYTLDVAAQDDGVYSYSIGGTHTGSGRAKAVEVMPGVYSVIEDTRSWLITLAEGATGWEAWIDSKRYSIALSDPRDRASQSGHAGASGTLEVRSLMPGKVIRVLTEVGASVSAGQGLVVVEAMKMQNELKAPRDGRVTHIAAVEGATVLAGAALVVLE